MTRKILLGIVWCIALYFIACTATGMIVGFIVGVTAHNPQNIEHEAREKAFNTVVSLRLYFAIAAVVIATIGAWKGLLPGTKTKPKSIEFPDDLR